MPQARPRFHWKVSQPWFHRKPQCQDSLMLGPRHHADFHPLDANSLQKAPPEDRFLK